ncbi:MAG: hypothetical protein FWB99_10595 [Treponema sp.]|nr:hypothetical protein [Treponema sp.]
MRRFLPLALALLLLPFALNAQDASGDFGFGDPDFDFWDFGAGDAGASGLPFSVSGEIKTRLPVFFDDFDGGENAQHASALDALSARLNVAFTGRSADVFVNLILSRYSIDELFDGGPRAAHTPLIIDEAFVRGFLGPLTITSGLRKLTWGRADSFGPLDVINPIDFSDLTRITEPQRVKIARPMIHASWAMGFNRNLEAVFVPWFQGDRFASSGRWTPSQVRDLQAGVGPFGINIDDYFPETATLEYAQGGVRFTATAGASDFGIQYFFGRLPRPAVTGHVDMTTFPPFIPYITHNRFQQIGVDFARVISGFNFRSEAGVNITSDLDGTDGTVENPAFVWSLGFDRDLFWRINLNLQGAGSVRLFHNEIGSNPFTDIEYGTDISSTRITAILSRHFLRNEIEVKTTALWGIEDRDFLVMPAVAWSRNDVTAELSAGFFGGKRSGELGQYRDNAFARFVLTYRF